MQGAAGMHTIRCIVSWLHAKWVRIIRSSVNRCTFMNYDLVFVIHINRSARIHWNRLESHSPVLCVRIRLNIFCSTKKYKKIDQSQSKHDQHDQQNCAETPVDCSISAIIVYHLLPSDLVNVIGWRVNTLSSCSNAKTIAQYRHRRRKCPCSRATTISRVAKQWSMHARASL